ncbi:hypothetical protein Vretimale_7937 [Volvox reticuliferus]|uniref:Nucleotide-diphospho-sugar transferase domain-containing protein n=1 Tax=Volvox reticuliferus TaxID=1737510 RepID=A0A8J4GAF7_9CHLO|nr:hypothetical protein Vretimale_7937 [Volvox reticuliferus]
MVTYLQDLRSSRMDQLSVLLLLAACPYLLEARDSSETFPLHRPLVDLREAAFQTVGRDGPRYPDEGFIDTVRRYRAIHNTSINAETESSISDVGTLVSDDCHNSYAVLTMANFAVMESLIPQLLESLHRIDLSTNTGASDSLARHTLVVGISTEALQACIRLRRRYKNGCLSDGISGLYEGDNRYPDFKYLAYGMAKLKYIVNVLSTGTTVLYVDADVVFLRNPFPDLLASSTDIAVATALAPCGTQPSKPDWAVMDGIEDAETDASAAATGNVLKQQHNRRALQGDEGDSDAAAATAAARGYAPGITFYRSTPGVMRCTYSLLLDMLNTVIKDGNATVLEEEHFAAFMPWCAEVLDVQLTELDPQGYMTCCGTDITPEVGNSSSLVAIHISGAPGSSLLDRQTAMEGLTGVKSSSLVYAAANHEQLSYEVNEEQAVDDGGRDSGNAAVTASESIQAYS